MPTTKIIVFGATGKTGLNVVQRGIEEGYEVTAYVRTPSKLPEDLRSKVNIAKGDVLNREQVEDAIEGHKVVLSTLGTGFTREPVVVMSTGIRNIISGMKKHNVRKLAVVSGGINLPNKWRPWFVKEIADDHDRMLKILEEEKEEINWVSIHPPFIKKSSKINPTYTLAKNVINGRSFVNTGEIADFMMKLIQRKDTFEQYRHCLVGISSGPPYITTFQLKILVASLALVSTGLVLCHFKII